MDAITGFVYGMSMMFFSMMAWMFWRKGSDRLFRLIMILMLIVDAQCLKDILSFYFTGFDNEENWFLISAADMFIIPFYSFVLMELVKPGWTTWRKAVMLELPFVLLPAIYCVTGNNIYFYILTVWGAVYGLTTFVVMFLPHQTLPSPAEGAVFLSGEHQSQLASGYPEQLFPDIDYLDDELLCHQCRF